MNLDTIADVPVPVDEAEVQAEILAWLNDTAPPEQRAPWTITSLGAADWAMRTVAEWRSRASEFADQAEAWRRCEKRAIRGALWLEERLAEWAIDRRTEKVKTMALAHGAVSTRTVKPTIELTDEDAAIAWARTHAPDAIHTTTRLNKSEVGDAWRIGEVVVGYEWTFPTTGEQEYHQAAWPAPFDPEAYAELVASEPDFVIEPCYEAAVIDTDGAVVPGVEVVPGRISATVKPDASW